MDWLINENFKFSVFGAVSLFKDKTVSYTFFPGLRETVFCDPDQPEGE